MNNYDYDANSNSDDEDFLQEKDCRLKPTHQHTITQQNGHKELFPPTLFKSGTNGSIIRFASNGTENTHRHTVGSLQENKFFTLVDVSGRYPHRTKLFFKSKEEYERNQQPTHIQTY